MKKHHRLFAIPLVLAFLVAACGGDEGTGDVEGNDLGGRTVVIAVENAYLPFNYIPKGETEPQGWDYDAWNHICEVINCVAEFEETAWDPMIDQVSQGEFDAGADGISITEERKAKVDYSDSYMIVEQKLIVQLDDDRYETVQDLVDDPEALIATQTSTTNLDTAVGLVGEDRVKAFDTFGLAVQALLAGDVDAVCIDDAAGLGYVGENADQIETMDENLHSDPLGFIFPKGSELVAPVNFAIQQMKDDGTMEELGVKFFGEGFTITYEDIE